jgi:ribonuclease BN (tRNA processing enzyme)
MKVKVLGCSGAISAGCRTTSFLVDDDLLVDAGTGVGDLNLEQLARIDHVVLSHSHMDHVAALPLLADSVVKLRSAPIEVHGLPETIQALQAHVFNWTIWPDFTVIPSPDRPTLRFHPFQVGEVMTLGGKQVEVLPAVHTVPAVGFAVSASSSGGRQWVFTGDTAHNPALWSRLAQLDVGMLVIETAFSDREAALAEMSKHLAPATLARELRQFKAKIPVHITHTKPGETQQIQQEIQALTFRGDVPDIRFLQAGQEFTL